jgi:hypothetical protein
MSYTEFKSGYAIESTYKTSVITGAGDTTYLLGQMATQNDWPSPTYNINYTGTGVNTKEVGAGLLFKSEARYEGMLALMMQNGIPCWLAMGKSSTAASVHTITPTTDGSLLPSLTWQTEEKGSGTNEEYQYQGVKVDSLLMSHDLSSPESNLLMAKLEVRGGSVSDPAFALTNDPALPATANADPYINLTRTWDSAGTPVAIDGLQKIEIAIANGLQAQYAHSYDTGTYTGRDPYAYTEAQRKQYQINLFLHPDTIERQLWDELVATGNTKDATFKWTRSTNDYILVTASDCQVSINTKHTPPPGKLNIEQVVLEPRALSIDVKDSIAGSFYGE